MRRPARGQLFLASVAKLRRTPGHCSRCGRLLPSGRKDGKCQPCRDHQQASRKAKRLATPPPAIVTTVDPAAVYRLQQDVAELRMIVRNMRRFATAMYAKGYARGKYAERKVKQEWDSWKQELDITVKRQHFHRVAAACGE